MTPTDRLLACLDVCEASGLFNATQISSARRAAVAGARVMPVHVENFDSLWIGFSHGKCCHVHTGADYFGPVALATLAATLTRVAEVAAKCDAMLRAE